MFYKGALMHARNVQQQDVVIVKLLELLCVAHELTLVLLLVLQAKRENKLKN